MIYRIRRNTHFLMAAQPRKMSISFITISACIRCYRCLLGLAFFGFFHRLFMFICRKMSLIITLLKAFEFTFYTYKLFSAYGTFFITY